jgi:hypothetical protein
MGIHLIKTIKRPWEDELPPQAVLLDERVAFLEGALAEAGYRVQRLPIQERGMVPPREPAWGSRAPLLITAHVRDWLVKDPNPLTLGVNLVNVRPILRHPDGCANVVIRALTEDLPAWDILWCDFDPDGRRHLMIFVRE